MDRRPFRHRDRGFGHVLLIGFGFDGHGLWLSSLLSLVGLPAGGFDLGQHIGAGLGGSDNAFGSAVGGTLGLIIQIIGFTVGGLLVGTLISFLGSYLAFDKNTNVQSATRPF